jgi:hypothetical protein
LYEQYFCLIYAIEKNYTFPTYHRMMLKKKRIMTRLVESMCALQGVEAHAAESGYGSWDDKLNVHLKLAGH